MKNYTKHQLQRLSAYVFFLMLFLMLASFGQVYTQNFPCENPSEWYQKLEPSKSFPIFAAIGIDSIPGVGKTHIVDVEPEVGNVKNILRQIVYPVDMKRQGIEAYLLYLVHVSEIGQCEGIFVRCAIQRNGRPLENVLFKEFDRAAAPVIKKTLWKPAQYQGKPVACWAYLRIPFYLR